MGKQAIFAVTVLFASAALFAEKQPFERYQSVIDRMPFGQPPPGFDPMRNPDEVSRSELDAAERELTQEQEAIQKAVQFSVINVEADGIVRVGFSDKSDAKSPRHYYMAVGEERGGWTVKAADAAAKTMTVVKDGVEVELKLGEATQGAENGKGAGRRGGAPATRSALLSRSGAGSAADGAAPAPFVSRRARREAEDRAIKEAREAAERLEAESRRRAEEEAKRREEDKAAREAEREEQREQLAALQEELRRSREAANAKTLEKPNADSDDGDSDEGGDDDED